MFSNKKRRSHIIQCLQGRELGLHLNRQDDVLRSFVEEKASLPNKNQACEISGRTRSTLLMEFSSDGKRIASTHGDHSIRVTDIRTGKCTHTLTGHPRTPWCIAFHPSNNDILGSGCLGGEVRIWDLKGGGSEVWHSDDGLSIASMTFHPSDNVVVFAISNKLHFWDWTRAEPFAVCETAHDFEKIRWVKFDCIGHRLLTAIANADESPSETSPFSLFGEGGRYGSSGTADSSHLHDSGVGMFYQPNRMSTNDDSLMDLRMSWGDHRNTVQQARSLNNARRYAFEVNDAFQRSSLNSRSMFASDTLGPARLHNRTSLRGNQQNTAAAASSDSGGVNLSMRPASILSSATPHSSSSSADDWLSTAPQERELEAGDALLSLAADGRQTPSRYVHSLSDDGAQRHFMAGSDPLSENLTLMEPGYVEVAPLTSAYEGFADRTVAASTPTTAVNDGQHANTLALNQLLQQDDAERSEETTSNPLSGDHRSESTDSSEFRIESQMETEAPSTSRSDNRERFPDIWFGPTTSWGIELSSTSTARQPSNDTESESSDVSITHLAESGLDLRLRTLGDRAGNSRGLPEHSYAMRTSAGNLSSTSADADLSFQSEGSLENVSAVAQPGSTDRWPASESAQIPGSPGPTLTPHHMFSDLFEPPSDEARPGETRDTNGTQDDSSARCRMFSYNTQRSEFASSSSSAAAASATVTSAAAAASSSACRTRQNDLRRVRRNRASSSLRAMAHARNHSDNPETPGVGCAVCVNAVSQIFNPGDVQPASSHVLPHASAEGHQIGRLSRFDGSPYSSSTSHVADQRTSVRRELNSSFANESGPRRPTVSSFSSGSRSRLLNFSDSNTNLDDSARQNLVIPRIEIFSDYMDNPENGVGENVAPALQGAEDRMHYLEPGIYRPTHFGGSRYTSISERMRERQERINFHVEELRSRFGSSSAAAGLRANVGLGSGSNSEAMRGGSGVLDEDLFPFQSGSSGYGSGADAVGDSLGNEDRAQIVNRLRGFREEIRAMRLEMLRNTQRDHDRLSRGYRYYMPLRHMRANRDSFLPADNDTQNFRMNAALNRAISGALIANGENSVGNNIGDQTFRIQAWEFIRCQIPDLTDSESNILVRRAKIHNDANVDVSQDGRLLCTFTLQNRSFTGDIMLSVFSLMSENFGECLYTKSFGPNAISVSISPCNCYILVGLATKRFTWMFTPKQMVAQVYQLKTPRAEEDSMEHVCDITHPCDMDFRAPISMNSARWLLGAGEGLAYGTNRGDLNIYRPGFDQIEKPEASDNLSDTNPIRRNLMQMLGLTVPRMMNSATQTNLNLRRSASTQTDQNSQATSSSLSFSSGAAANM